MDWQEPPAVSQPAPQSRLQSEATVLIQQSANRIFNASERLAFVLGKCSVVMPTASSLPSVVRAGDPIAEVNWPEIYDGVSEASVVGYAEGLQESGQRGLTVRACASDVNDAAEDARAHGEGLVGLLRTLASDAQRTR